MGCFTVDQNRNGPFYFKDGAKMNRQLEAQIRKEIRKRALEQSDRLRQKKQKWQDIQHTLDALHEVTGLPRHELEVIANEARLSFEASREEFFSIKKQILMASSISGFIIISVWLLLTLLTVAF